MSGEPAFCGDPIAFWENGGRTRTLLRCVDQPGHDPDIAHRSATIPVIRWRTIPRDPNVRDLRVEPWQDSRGRPADLLVVDDPAAWRQS